MLIKIGQCCTAPVDDIMNGYFLYGIDNEMLMVIRGQDEEVMFSIIQKLKRSKEEDIRKLAETLENHFYDRNTAGGSSSKTRSKNPQNGRKRGSGRNTKTKDS
jgi:hypothetical protein